MIIKEIIKDKKHLSKVIFDSGEEVFLDNDILSLYCIHKEDSITDDKLENLIYESNYQRAKSRAIWYLDRGDLTEKALFDKLIKAGFDEKAVACVIARMIEIGLIDDIRFAQNFAERCEECNISKKETIFKLISKGIPYDMAKQTVEELSFDEEEQIKNLLERKYHNKLQDKKSAYKVYAALCRKGFTFSAVRNAMKKYIEELEYYV